MMRIKYIAQCGGCYSEFYCIFITDGDGNEFKSDPMLLWDVIDFMNAWRMNH